ncbi:ABC transporter ATP-binding protein [Candidatus Gracilibacteria bacterium]|nr:ABC transporter ATP-binding protein [Candidatus Gracilibacteria bacterium]
MEPLVEGAMALSTVLVVWFGGQRVLRGELPIEDVVAFLFYLVNFYQPIWLLTDVNEAWQQGIASIKRIDEVLRLEPEVAEAPDAITPTRLAGELHLAHVDFAYRPDQPVLHDVSLSVAAGQTLALVGPTGAGKSTIVSLLARFYDPQRGQVLIDGIDARQLGLAALRRNLSMVLQDVFLFNGNVRENIRFGKPAASDAEVETAARIANAHDFTSACRKGTTRRSASVACGSPAGRNSASRSRGRCGKTRRSCCSTKRPPPSIPRPSISSRRPCSGGCAGAPVWGSPTAFPRCATPIGSRGSRAGAWWSAAATPRGWRRAACTAASTIASMAGSKTSTMGLCSPSSVGKLRRRRLG